MTARCFKCGSEAAHQWRVCADGPWRWVCAACDLELNYIALRWAYGPTKAWRLYQQYKRRCASEQETAT